MNKRIINYLSENPLLLPVLITALTLITMALTLLPGEYLPSTSIFSHDKLGHFLMFGSWTFLIGLYSYIISGHKLHLFTVFAAGIFFGVSIEVLQYLLPIHRQADFFDVVFDSLGCFVAIVILKKALPED